VTIQYYAVIPHPTEESLLLLRGDEGWTLPRFERDDFFWAKAGGLNGAVQDSLGLQVTTRRSLLFQPPPEPGEKHWVYAMENHSPDPACPGSTIGRMARWRTHFSTSSASEAATGSESI
jgi:hypothetical protein